MADGSTGRYRHDLQSLYISASLSSHVLLSSSPIYVYSNRPISSLDSKRCFACAPFAPSEATLNAMGRQYFTNAQKRRVPNASLRRFLLSFFIRPFFLLILYTIPLPLTLHPCAYFSLFIYLSIFFSYLHIFILKIFVFTLTFNSIFFFFFFFLVDDLELTKHKAYPTAYCVDMKYIISSII